MLTIDGNQGEGGGQIVRTSLTLSTILNRPIRLKNIRAKRRNPGLAAQHLTAVWAAAKICEAEVRGDELGSTQLVFTPRSAPRPDSYEFDVSEAREGGSAGAISLILQTILFPLALAPSASQVTLKGGTHVAWSPTVHYIQHVFLPMVAQLGFQAELTLKEWGWYPAGQGEIQLEISGEAQPQLEQDWYQRDPLKQVEGIAVSSSLPAHIAQRICNRAINLLEAANIPIAIEPQRVRSVSPGAGLFLCADYGTTQAGFTSLGKRGKPSEKVAEAGVKNFFYFHKSPAVLDRYLTDQMILPLVLAGADGKVSVQKFSEHTLTNLWVLEQFFGPVGKVHHQDSSIEFFRKIEKRLEFGKRNN